MKTQTANVVFSTGDLARKVSDIVPLYNYANYIAETLNSVAGQSLDDLALIVIDDASTDDSRQVVEAWMHAKRASGMAMSLLANDGNAGLAVTRNTGVAHAQSDYCFFLDADNLLFPRCLEKHARALDARPDCAGAYAIIEEFGNATSLIGANSFNKERLKRGNYIDAMTMLRRDTVEALGGFHPIRHGWEDYDLWLRLCEAGEELLLVPEVLSRYRNHASSMLRQQTNIDESIGELTQDMRRRHPWVQLETPIPRPRWRDPSRHRRQRALGRAPERAPANPIASGAAVPAAKPTPYKLYEQKIFAKLSSLDTRQPLPIDVAIDTDFTGPIHGTPFDSFVSARQREDSERQTLRMLASGIVAINPAPGVHASRRADGTLIRFRSLAARESTIVRMPSDLLIHIHAFYPDVVAEMLACFEGRARGGRFLVTTTTQNNQSVISRMLDDHGFSSSKTILIENKGRDIGPFLDHVIDQASDNDVICHIHTKKSPDVGGTYGEKWRKALYGALLNQTAVDAFRDPRLGLLFPDTPRSVGWGKNRAFCEQIGAALGRSLPPHPGPMPVGNMFYVRKAVALSMQHATQGAVWPREPVPYDGTVLHAIERMWSMACEHAGYDWAAVRAL
ncbi:rhamnan synthesis F family protein [Novosphingobium sp. FKTRR1]|uniref:rhamnan synthesis F family protein n=1 Tax=Novosphingobium sp. FKTRR1 TaxID=2879118 RepID=UPI001CF06780|nr:rhamnan synthesis F family protein [Novosphingobium sp. FKTRR1]